MNYTKLISECIARIEQSAGKHDQANVAHLENAKTRIIELTEFLHRQVQELQNEIVVLRAVNREGRN